MTVFTDAPVPVEDTVVTKSNGVKYLVAAVVASVAVLGTAALLSDDARVGDNRTNSLSSYLTGNSTDGSYTSAYTSNR